MVCNTFPDNPFFGMSHHPAAAAAGGRDAKFGFSPHGPFGPHHHHGPFGAGHHGPFGAGPYGRPHGGRYGRRCRRGPRDPHSMDHCWHHQEQEEEPRVLRQNNLHVADFGDNVQLSIDFPGVKASDLTIQVEDRVLIISGKRFIPTEDGVRAVEYSRRFHLDESIDAKNLSANLADGVLVLTATKIRKAGPTNIPVTANPSQEPQDEENDDDMVLVDIQEEGAATNDGEKKPAAVDSPAEPEDNTPEAK
eukprot:CAMPEP_0119017260 /NCGR_PEP_ID=MMETSP1176-20130426/15938_1 /TAXON_ID=265551 /ORGANISM="Synedropsis recta cf, Strain CCMP1620" /LENGTH=248 /DNA_ID=CAMNT_0006970931 /DNA_START=23 /DNA_END=769 /DNA_ORIENTATION=+